MSKAVTDAEFDRVVGILERRARIVLMRWAAIGNNHIRITRGGRMNDYELRDRSKRLQETAEGLASRLADVLGAAHTVAGPVNEARAGLTIVASSPLPQSVLEAELENIWTALLEAAANTDAILKREARPLDDFLTQLTPEELNILSEVENDEGRDPAPLLRLGSLVAYLNDIVSAATEARELLSGRFHQLSGKHRPKQIRGRRLAAQLLGAAEGLGLRPSRNREPANGQPGRSAADAMLTALERCAGIGDPVVKAILKECPKQYLAVEKRLIPATAEGPDGDPLLIREHEDGRRRVAHWT